jgi:6-phosphogluconolactonase
MTRLQRGFPFFLLLATTPLASGEERLRPAAKDTGPTRFWAYVGTYTRKGGSEGIYRFDFDAATGKLSARALAAKTASPSFLAIHPGRKFLYAVGEMSSVGKKGGALVAFAIDPKTGDLTRLNQQSSEGAGPCHVVVDAKGKYLLAANYGGGNACCLPIEKGGKLGKATGFVQHEGSSVNKARQERPHAHSVNLSPDNRFAFVADLGIDKVMIYKLGPKSGALTPNDPPSASVAPGAGPRHFAFHPSGKYAYVINELDSTVTAFAYDAAKGALKTLQTVPTLAKPHKGNSTAEVVVHPSGKFLYGSNRGHNSIASFAIDTKTGKLTPTGHQGKDVKVPRNFVVDPTGKWALVANQDGNSIVVFRIDTDTGKLEPTGHKVEVPTPVCIRLMPR